MRTIKFRAWDKEHKRWVCARLEADGWHIVDDIRDAGPLSEWLQFTGLTDRQGKEIYEGDVLSYGKDSRTMVKFGFLNENDDEVMAEITGWYEEHIQTGKIRPLKQVGEIIGNIYEHPELLTEAGA